MFLKVSILMLLINTSLGSNDKESHTDVKKDSRTVYDQRQTGKYNVHVNIKDVQFFSIKDALSSLGDYGSYDYGDYGSIEGGDISDYDISHLTVNPIFAFLGTHAKPTKPSTTSTSTEKSQSNMSIASQEGLSSTTNKEEMTSLKQELDETTVKKENISNISTSTTEKPALRPLKVNESIDYEEIPVEVQYYRANQSKLPLVYASSLQNNNRHAINFKRHRRPSVVQILDGRTNNNVKIVESDDQERTVKICGRGEFRDSHGRCRIKANSRNRVPGLRRVFNVLSSLLPNSK